MRNNKFATAFAWLISTSIGQQVCQFVTFILLARMLSPSDFGLVGASMIVLSFLRLFSELGVGPALVQKASLTEVDVSTAVFISLILGVSLSVVMFFSAAGIAVFFDMPHMEPLLKVMIFMLPASSISVVGLALLQRQMRFKEIALLNLASFVVGYFFVAIPMALLDQGVWALVAAYLTQSIATSLFVLFIKFGYYSKIRFNYASGCGLLKYGFGISLARVGNFFANQADNIVIGKMLGAEALGFYGRAYQLMVMPAMLLGGVIEKILFPHMSEIQNQEDRLVGLFIRITGIIVMVMLPCSVFLAVFAEEIIFFLLGDKWVMVVIPFQILASSLVFRMAYKVCESLVHARSAVYQRAWREFFYAALVFISAWVGHFWGLEGIAAGVAFSVFIHFLFMMQLSKSVLSFSGLVVLRVYIRHASLGALLALVIYIVKIYLTSVEVPVFVTLLAGVFAAAFFYYALWVLVPGVFGKEGRDAHDLFKGLREV